MSSDGEEFKQAGAGFQDLLDQKEEEGDFVWAEEEEEEERRAVISFRLGKDRFSVAGELVREILGAQEVTALPGSPGHILGIAVLRRQVVAIVSLREFLNIPGEDRPAQARTMIVECGPFTVGLVVDEILGLGEWVESGLSKEKVPENLRASMARYARGAQVEKGELHLFLDLEGLLEDAAVR